MADEFWKRRIEGSAAILLGTCALLSLLSVILDAGDASQTQIMSVLAFGLGVLAVVAATITWSEWFPTVIFLPALVVVGATAIAIVGGGLTDTIEGIVGLTLVCGLVLVYVGFVSPPGMALATMPLLLVLLLIGRQVDPGRLSLAVPIVAVPGLTLIGELVSYLTSRNDSMVHRNQIRLAELDRLSSVLRQFRRPSSLEEAATQICEASIEAFRAQRATIVLRTTEGDLLTETSGPSVAAVPESTTAQLLASAVTDNEPTLIRSDRHGQVLVVPLPTDDGIPAGAVLLHPVRSTDEEFVLDMATIFQNSVAIAIAHLYVIDQLHRRALIDPLTDLGNRRHADRLLRSLASGDAVVLLDLDGFKRVNDTQGHAAGDEVLRMLSKHLKTTLRDSDTSARLGGDEFLIVARQAFADPLTVAERVVTGWAELNQETTLSAGVALHETEATSAETLDLADRALIEAKKMGKNRALLAPPPPGSGTPQSEQGDPTSDRSDGSIGSDDG